MKNIKALLMCIVFLTTFVSCSRSNDDLTENSETVSPEETSDTASEEDLSEAEETEIRSYELNEFDKSLIDYLESSGYYSSNYIISPVSYRASLCLAAAGAEGNTRTELVSAAGFSGMDELELWHRGLQNTADRFKNDLNSDAGSAFSMGSSVWNNMDLMGDFTNSYKTRIWERFSSEVYTPSSDELTSKLNGWIDEKTEGSVTKITDDISGASTVLVSTLYMQTMWRNGFSSSYDGVFTDINGSESNMEFMEQTARLLYAEETGTKIVVLPMKDDVSFVCFMGNRIGMFDKTAELKRETVHVVLPKFEEESVFDATDLLNFLLSRGVSESTNSNIANFYNMCNDSDWFLQEIMQAAALSVNEGQTGTGSASGSDEEEIKEFAADGPFSYAVFSGLGTSDQQLLFYGQMMTIGE